MAEDRLLLVGAGGAVVEEEDGDSAVPCRPCPAPTLAPSCAKHGLNIWLCCSTCAEPKCVEFVEDWSTAFEHPGMPGHVSNQLQQQPLARRIAVTNGADVAAAAAAQGPGSNARSVGLVSSGAEALGCSESRSRASAEPAAAARARYCSSVCLPPVAQMQSGDAVVHQRDRPESGGRRVGGDGSGDDRGCWEQLRTVFHRASRNKDLLVTIRQLTFQMVALIDTVGKEAFKDEVNRLDTLLQSSKAEKGTEAQSHKEAEVERAAAAESSPAEQPTKTTQKLGNEVSQLPSPTLQPVRVECNDFSTRDKDEDRVHGTKSVDGQRVVPATAEAETLYSPARATGRQAVVAAAPSSDVILFSNSSINAASASHLPLSSFHGNCYCLDVSFLRNGMLIVAAKSDGLIEFDHAGQRLSCWKPWAARGQQPPRQGDDEEGGAAAEDSRKQRQSSKYSHGEQVRTVDVTLDGLVVTGLRRAKQVVILAPPTANGEQWTELGRVQLSFEPWRLAARGDAAAVTGIPTDKKSGRAPPLNIVSLITGGDCDGGSKQRVLASIDVGYSIAGVALSDDVVVVSSWCDAANVVQCFSRQSGASLWSQTVDDVALDLLLSHSGRLLYVLFDQHLSAVDSDSGARWTHVVCVSDQPTKELKCLHSCNLRNSICQLVIGAASGHISVYLASGSV